MFAAALLLLFSAFCTQTKISFLSVSPQLAIQFINSSSSIRTIILNLNQNDPIISVSPDSSLDVTHCSLICHQPDAVPFSSAGRIQFSHLTIPSFTTVLTLTNNAGSHLATTVLKDSTFSNMDVHPTVGTFVSSGYLTMQTVRSCLFSNISIANSPSSNRNSINRTVTDGCALRSVTMLSCENLFYGSVISGLSSKNLGGFHCINSTFAHTARYTVANEKVEGQTYYERQSRFTSSQSGDDMEFRWCTFTNIHTSKDSYGGALYIQEYRHAEEGGAGWHWNGYIYNCAFKDCSAKKTDWSNRGGALYMGEMKNTYINDSNWTSCSVASGDEAHSYDSDGGAIYIAQCEFFHLVNCRFSLCKAGNFGGAVYVEGMQQIAESSMGDACVTECLFDQCTAKGPQGTGSGGGLYYNNVKLFYVYNTQFKSCAAEKYGGGFYYRTHSGCVKTVCSSCDSVKVDRPIIIDCTFSGNSAQEGIDGYFEFYGDFTVLSPFADTNDYQDDLSTRAHVRYNVGGECGTKKEENAETDSKLGAIFYVNDKPGDDATCRNPKTTHCVTVQEAYEAATKLYNNHDKDEAPLINILLLPQQHSQPLGKITADSLTVLLHSNNENPTVTFISASKDDGPFLTVEDVTATLKGMTFSLSSSVIEGSESVLKPTVLFYVNKAKSELKLQSMVFNSVNSEDKKLQANLLELSNGKIEFTKVQFAQIKTQSSLFRISGGTPTFTETTFNAIEGPIFGVTDLSTQMTFSGVGFTSCPGVLSAELKDSGTFVLTDVKFKECSSAGAGVLEIGKASTTRSNLESPLFTVDTGDDGTMETDTGGSITSSLTSLNLLSTTFVLGQSKVSLVTANAGTLALTSVVVKPIETHVLLTCSIISINEGCNIIQVKSSKFSKLQTSAATPALLKCADAVSLTSCSFAGSALTSCDTSIDTKVSGGLVFIRMAASGKLQLDSLSAYGCQYPNSYGGVFYIDWTSWTTAKSLPVTFTGAIFTDNKAESGADLFFETSDPDHEYMKTYTHESLFNFRYTSSETSVFGLSNKAPKQTAPVNLLKPKPTDEDPNPQVRTWTYLPTIYVSADTDTYPDATNDIDCGPKNKPCKSINVGLTHLGDAPKSRANNDPEYAIIILKKAEITMYLTLTDVLVKSNDNNLASIEVNYTKHLESQFVQAGFITASGTVVLKLVEFKFLDFVPNTFTCFFTTDDSSSLRIEQCTVTANNAGVPTFASINKGELNTVSTAFTPGQASLSVGGLFAISSKATFDENTKINIPSPLENEVTSPSTMDDEKFCAWSTGTIHVSGETADVQFKGFTFENHTYGALLVTDSATVTLDGTTFKSNTISNTDYASFQRNVMCTGGNINVPKLQSATSLWIAGSPCSVSTPNVQLPSTFFIPVLDKATATTDDNKVTITYEGSLFIPCTLGCVIKFDDEEPVQINLHAAGATETKVVSQLDGTNVDRYNDATTVKTYITFGKDGKTLEYTLKKSAEGTVNDGDGDKGGKISMFGTEIPLYVFIPVLCAILLLLLLLLLLLICCCCCRKKQEEEPEERKELYLAEESAEKHEQVPVPTVGTATIGTINPSLMVEGILAKPPHKGVLADVQNSLFAQIHNSAQRQSRNPFAWAATVATECIDGLTFMLDRVYGGQFERNASVGHSGQKQISTSVMRSIISGLSPHSILFTDNGEMTLSSVPPTVNIYIFPDSDETDTFESELRRYTPQEVLETGPSKSRVGVEAALSYAIGMLIYEVFTGWVPFDGYKASEASEMAGNGMRPDTTLISQVDTSFTEIVEKCYAQNPAERLSLRELKSKLAAYLPAQEGQIRAKVRGSDVDSL